jgi:hypothetical protein
MPTTAPRRTETRSRGRRTYFPTDLLGRGLLLDISTGFLLVVSPHGTGSSALLIGVDPRRKKLPVAAPPGGGGIFRCT